MEIQSKTNFGAEVRALKVARNDKDKADVSLDDGIKTPFGAEVSAAAHERNSMRNDTEMALSADKQIIEANFNIKASEKSMSILSREAIDQVIASLNEKLKESVVPVDDIQTAYDNGLDVSPEATANRIVSMSTAFYGAFQAQNPELSEEESLDKFMEVIGGGIERGFSEARDILGGLDVLQGDIADNIDKTYDLVQKGLQSFQDGELNVDEGTEPEQDVGEL